MANTKSQASVSNSEAKERYTLGYSSQTVQRLQRRTAAKEAGFLLSHLSAGMRLLDCGCGPGSITAGLAEVVAPGQVVGVDIEPSQYRSVWSQAAKRPGINLHFAVADVYSLPFVDNFFDAAFLHNVLSHLQRPLEVLKGIYRLLSPGGVIGISHPDFSGLLISPSDPLLDRDHELYWRLVEHNGGNPAIGKHQRALLHEAGFVRIEAIAKYSTVGTQDGVRMRAEHGGRLFGGSAIAQQMIDLGWTDRSELDQIIAAWRKWSEHPGAFMANATVTAVGWKE